MMAGIQIPIEMLFMYLKDGGFTNFECTPGGGFNVGVGVATSYRCRKMLVHEPF